jgi:MFS family permease
MREDPRPHEHAPGRWFPPPVLLPGVILGFGNVTYAAMSGFLILLLRHRGHGSAWAFSAFAFAVLFGRAAFGGLPDRVGPRRSLFAGYFFLAAGLLIIALGAGPALDVPAALLIGLGYSFPWPALASVVIGRVPINERAAALGALTAFYDLFVAGSSAVAGAVAGFWGLQAVFWLALGSVAAAFAVVLITGIGSEFGARRVRYAAATVPGNSEPSGDD